VNSLFLRNLPTVSAVSAQQCKQKEKQNFDLPWQDKFSAMGVESMSYLILFLCSCSISSLFFFLLCIFPILLF
jgi:hypothetical protein